MVAYNRILGHVGKYAVVDIFPYDIQDKTAFIHRDHIPADRNNPESRQYTKEVWKRIIEGYWANDNGTAVFMPPKLYFYVNLGTISLEDEDKSRYEAYPDMWDNGWIIFTYILCCDGFSGFSEDEDFTCNIYIDRLEKGEEVSPQTLKGLEATCKRKNGTWKKYINAWDYLTTHYLIDVPRETHRGKALYQNPSYNGMILGSRKSTKTYCLAAGDCIHEFITNGCRDFSKIKRKNKINLFVGSVDTNFVNSFLTIAETSWRNIPGGSEYELSPFFRDAEGQWLITKERAPIIQGYRSSDKEKSFVGSKTEITKAVILPNTPEVAVSRRLRRAYNDECGLDENIEAFYGATDGALRATGDQSGSLMSSGTGGNIVAIQAVKELANNPNRFSIYPIPNYWKDNKPFVLFLPASYTKQHHKNEGGNTDVLAATKEVVADRNRLSGGDDGKIGTKRQQEPLEPPEMFLVGKSEEFDKETIIDRIELLEEGLWKNTAKLYDIKLSKRNKDGSYNVSAEEKEIGWNNVITDLDYGKKTGELVVYEPPMLVQEPFALFNSEYKIVLDPVTDMQTGRSYVSILVYKGMPRRSLEIGEMIFNVVAEFKGRWEGDDCLKLALCLALWYKCRIQYERNVSGIPRFFNSYGLGWLLQPTPRTVIKDIIPNTTQRQESGIFMNALLKAQAFQKLKTWHKAIVYRDEIGRQFKQIETCYSLAALYEMNQYDAETNLDHISSLLILMLWLEEENIPGQEEVGESMKDDFEELAVAARQLTYAL